MSCFPPAICAPIEALETGAEPLGVDEALTSVLLDMIDRHAGGLSAVGPRAANPRRCAAPRTISQPMWTSRLN